jgi:hypothetical protein
LVDTAGSELVDLVFATKEDNTGGPIRPIERMCITYQGNVGIGIKEPTSLLHVNGKIKASSLEVTSVLAPTSSGGTTYGVGSNGQVLKSNGTTAYWGTDTNTTYSFSGGNNSFTVTPSAGSAQSVGVTSTKIFRQDTRNDNPAPYATGYANSGYLSLHLKTNSTLGITGQSDYSALVEVYP